MCQRINNNNDTNHINDLNLFDYAILSQQTSTLQNIEIFLFIIVIFAPKK